MPSSQAYDESEELESGGGTGAEDNQPAHEPAKPKRTPSSSSAPHSEDEERQEWADDMFEIVARLGEGAGGAVSKVRDKRTGRVMARKTIPTGTVPARQLLRELQFSQLNHPNLIACYGAYISSSGDSSGGGEGNNQDGSNGSGVFTPEIHILMELGEGGALDSIARQMKTRHDVRIGEKVIARLAEGVLKGLDYLHDNKVTHRDIKPSNILLTKTGVVKLCDFGVSGVLEGSLASTFTGTSWYMAPERITGHKYSIRADVWSTGITFLELAQNRFPYPPDLGPIELLTYIVNGEVPELDDEPGDENGHGAIVWSDGMKSFIKQCLRIDAATRPPPRDILLHPWIQESMARKLDMAKWIREVWGWEKPSRSKRASQAGQ
ncbi:kinase-like protein [Ceratobasidium sp. AG-I]|nr:kinase-like protein [Ceratobasidium sp. AG-I]